MNITNAELYCVILLTVLMVALFNLVRSNNERDALRRDYLNCKMRLEKITKILDSVNAQCGKEHKEMGDAIATKLKSKVSRQSSSISSHTGSSQDSTGRFDNRINADAIIPITVNSSPAPFYRDEPSSHRSSDSHTSVSFDSGSSYSSCDSGSSNTSSSSCD